MKIQEDLYDLCEDCFKYLALQIDKVFGEVKGLKEMKSPKSEKKDNLTVAARTANEEQVGPDSSKEVEEKVEINPSKEVGQLLVGKIGSTTLPSDPSGASSLSGAHSAQINAALERAVADLQASLRRLEVFSVDANEMVKKWSELPVDMQRRNRHQDLSTGSSASKADVFWAHYMDRECDLLVIGLSSSLFSCHRGFLPNCFDNFIYSWKILKAPAKGSFERAAANIHCHHHHHRHHHHRHHRHHHPHHHHQNPQQQQQQRQQHHQHMHADRIVIIMAIIAVVVVFTVVVLRLLILIFIFILNNNNNSNNNKKQQTTNSKQQTANCKRQTANGKRQRQRQQQQQQQQQHIYKALSFLEADVKMQVFAGAWTRHLPHPATLYLQVCTDASVWMQDDAGIDALVQDTYHTLQLSSWRCAQCTDAGA